MTDEEKAEEIIKEKYCNSCEERETFPNIYNCSAKEHCDDYYLWKEGILLGLAEGRKEKWHYIKNGDYPKDNTTVLALCIIGGQPYPYLAQYWKGSTTTKKNGADLNWICWLNNMQREVVEPYAWKEITFPKES